MLSKIRNFSFFIILFAGIDQAIKFYLINIYNINTSHLNSQFMEKINDYLNLYLIWNKGFAFGLFQNDLQSINNFYMIIMLVLIIFLFFYAIKIDKKIYYFAFSLIIGGAIGNLIDRFLYQAVLDFIDIHYMNYHWYVFNFADITITVGCLLVIILELFSGKNKKENA